MKPEEKPKEIRNRFYWEKRGKWFVVVDSTGELKSDATMKCPSLEMAESLTMRLNSTKLIED